MNARDVTLPSGQQFQVAQGIQRIDSKSTHGWQVRYQGTKLFSDGVGADPRHSLAEATKELLKRISTMSAPSSLQQRPSANKTSDLPPGISGPIVRAREGRTMTAAFSVLLPQFGGQAKIKSIYIGSQNTYTERKYREALEKCIQLRAIAIERYERDVSHAQRATIAALKTQLRTLSRTGT